MHGRRVKGRPDNPLDRLFGEPRRAILAMVPPIAVSLLVVQINQFADAFWCSGLGADAISAMASIGPLFWGFAAIGFGLSLGANATVSRCLGMREHALAERAASQAISLSIIIGIAITPFFILAVRPVVDLMGADALMPYCEAYVYPQLVAGTLAIMSGTVAGIMRGEGAATRSMAMLLTGVVANMVLDPLLIYGLGGGLAGAGTATALSSAVPLAVAHWWYRHGELVVIPRARYMRPTRDGFKAIMSVGGPRSAEGVLNDTMTMLNGALIIGIGGTVSIMLYNVTWNFINFSQVLSRSTGMALVSVSSAALGQGDVAKARAGYRYALMLVIGGMSIIAAVLFIFAEWAVVPFTYAPSMAEYHDDFVRVLRIYAVLIPFAGIIDVGSSMLQSLRKSPVSALLALVRNCMVVLLMFFYGPVASIPIFWIPVIAAAATGLMALVIVNSVFSERARAEPCKAP